MNNETGRGIEETTALSGDLRHCIKELCHSASRYRGVLDLSLSGDASDEDVAAAESDQANHVAALESAVMLAIDSARHDQARKDTETFMPRIAEKDKRIADLEAEVARLMPSSKGQITYPPSTPQQNVALRRENAQLNMKIADLEAQVKALNEECDKLSEWWGEAGDEDVAKDAEIKRLREALVDAGEGLDWALDSLGINDAFIAETLGASVDQELDQRARRKASEALSRARALAQPEDGS